MCMHKHKNTHQMHSLTLTPLLTPPPPLREVEMDHMAFGMGMCCLQVIARLATQVEESAWP